MALFIRAVDATHLVGVPDRSTDALAV